MADIIDYGVFRRFANHAANAAERKLAAAEHRKSVRKVMVTTQDLCKRMAANGWLSDLIADVNTGYSLLVGSESDTQAHFNFEFGRERVYSRDTTAFYQTSTYQAWRLGQPVPVFRVANAVSDIVRYRDPNRLYERTVLVDVGAGLLSAEYDGKRLVGFLKDIPPSFLASSLPKGDILPDIEADAISAREGAVFVYRHLRHERDTEIIAAKRRQVLEVTGRLACSGCSFDFRQFYGEVGAGFCEIHHLKPLGEADGEVITQLDDLAIVCSNCHRMIHRGRPLLTIEELKSKIEGARVLGEKRRGTPVI